jgi:hypothetical protein
MNGTVYVQVKLNSKGEHRPAKMTILYGTKTGNRMPSNRFATRQTKESSVKVVG